MPTDIRIRPVQSPELEFLEEMLFEAIFIPPGVEKPPKNIIYRPELYRYVDGFGRSGDVCLVAESGGKLIAAIWTRLFTADNKGYGFVDERTPELSMAVVAGHRNKGTGTKLLVEMARLLAALDYEKVSLSVDTRNPAYRLYQRAGFLEIHADGNSAVLVRHLQENALE